jgi:hypothetical protein
MLCGTPWANAAEIPSAKRPVKESSFLEKDMARFLIKRSRRSRSF